MNEQTNGQTTDSYRNVNRYLGQDYRYAPTYIRPRAPTTGDIKPKEQQGHYPVTSFWSYPPQQKLWGLVNITNNLANWVLLSSGGIGPLLMVTVPNGTSPIVPDGTGTMNFTSSGGTVVITGSSASPNNHTINFDITGGAVAIEKVNLDTGTTPIVPTAGAITLTAGTVAAGTHPIRTDGTGASTAKIEAQFSQAIASTDATKVGLSNYSSADFTVDANGFVQSNGRTIKWNVINQGTQPANFVINNGYICQAGGTGNVSIALPTTSALGDEIAIVLDGATSWTITQAASQQIRISGSQTTAGVGGSVTTTGTGDTLTLVCETANLKWVSFVGHNGNLVVT